MMNRLIALSPVVLVALALASPVPAGQDLAGPAMPAANQPPRIVTGAVAFTKQVVDDLADQTHSVVAADLDADGDLDLAATDYGNGAVYWYENDGSGAFARHVLDGDLLGAYPSHVGDLDRDGDPDVLACGYLSDTVAWYENDGLAGFTRHDVDTTASGAHSVVIVDLDEDGDHDLLTTDQDGGNVNWYENDGALSFVRHEIDGAANGAKRAEAADLDGDGDLDVAAAANYIDQVTWYENDGAEGFTEHLIDPDLNGAYYVFPADVDGDGDLDLLAASEIADTVRLYRNDGAGSFTLEDVDDAADGSRTVIAVDLDRDGDLDLVTASPDDDTVGWYENDGTGAFTKRAIDTDADGAYGVFAIDIDFDGDPDVLSASRDADVVAVHRQIRAHQARLGAPGGTVVIDGTMLSTVDADDGPAELTYTLIEIPAAGELRLDGAPVPAGGIFTQADVDADLLAYVHDGSPTASDGFVFTVADGGEDGVAPATGTFAIGIPPLLAAHWPLDEAAGTVAEDVAGEQDGVLAGDPVWQPDGGVAGGALALGGDGDRVDVGAFDIEGGAGLSLALWLRPASLTVDARLLSKATGTAEQSHYWMISTYAGTAVRFRLKAGGVTSTLFTGTGQIAVDEWHHVACTYDLAEMRIYVDGALRATLAKTGAVDLAPAVDAAIGDQPPGAGSYPFDGLIDDVRIYRGALSEPEVAALADTTATVSAVGRGPAPARRILRASVPNPFNPATVIHYDLPREEALALAVHDLRGRRVRTLVDGRRPAGPGSVLWDGRDGHGARVPAGVYLVRLRAAGRTESIKITLVE